jgi:PLP dependent protein
MASISDNIIAIQERINAAAIRSGRVGADVTLVTVTKMRSVAEIREAIACGITDIGENYVQEAEEKNGGIGDQVKWHMIGHLQKNKARHAVEFFNMIHGVDSEELAREIGRRAEAIGKCVDILLEVKISGEDTKFGVQPEDIFALVQKISPVSGIRVLGLMGMAPFVDGPEQIRLCFRTLKMLWDKLPNEQRLYLSMGMTQDFEIAIEEGSNMVRIGTAIFGPRS